MDLELISQIRSAFEELPDFRKQGNNQKYELEDAALSAFSVFFTQSQSFLDYQQRMQKLHNRNNAQSIFGVHKIPSTSQIGNILDPIAPETLYPVLAGVGDKLYEQGCLKPFLSVGGTLLVAMDGTDSFSSEKISCPCCTQQTQKSGKTLYRHTLVTPVIVAPGQSRVVPLPPEFVRAQDGVVKQDCELAAAKRWLTQWGDHYAPRGITLLGDDLYCHQPFCEAVRAQQMDFLFVCKLDSHTLLYEWVADFSRTGDVKMLEKSRWNGKQRLTEHYRYINQVPLRNSDDALMVNWCEITILNAKQEVVYRNAWATSHAIDEDNVADMVVAGRARWKIENENNNVLKNHGYHFEHNFAHGKQHLSNVLATLNLLAFLTHTALEWLDEAYRAVRNAAPSRRTFFENLRTLLQFIPFDNWQHLMQFMQYGGDKLPVKT
jgi:hypothetical protein